MQTITIVDLNTLKEYANFEGVSLQNWIGSFLFFTLENNHIGPRCSIIHEIPNTKLIVSLTFAHMSKANMAIFDISHRGRPKRVFTFEEVSEGKSTFSFIEIRFF